MKSRENDYAMKEKINTKWKDWVLFPEEFREEVFNFKWQIEALNLLIWSNAKSLPGYMEWILKGLRKVEMCKINLMKKSSKLSLLLVGVILNLKMWIKLI